MSCRPSGLLRRLLSILVLTLFTAAGQSLVLNNDVHTATALAANTTATLTGKAELRVTGGGDPVPGCTIHLNSPDAWLFMSAFRPSQVAGSFLGRVRVNGAAAVLDQNVRVVQYENGAVVIPHGPDFTPMEIFDGKGFTGKSKKLGLYTYHNDTNLGALKSATRSFRLKRGYMATVAQQENGMGYSKVFIAQDADIEMSALPGNLDKRIRFIRVFPWRWTCKKGWGGGDGHNMRHSWHYDWGAEANSNGLDSEYVPMRHGPYWPGFDIINAKRNVTHLLGYNEPDNTWDPAQTPQTVDQALAQWPELMRSGLRLGSPVVTEGNLGWLYEFIDRADALGYRVDFVSVHFYQPNKSAWDLHVLLRQIHERTRRPIWLKEFNNGANWTCCPPTQQENAARIGEFIDMMNGWSPFVERYAVFNWVGDTRRMVWDGGAPLPAGERYRDTLSPLAQAHEMPDTGISAAAHYVFEENTHDSSGNGNDGAIIGAASFTTGKSGRAIVFDGSDSFVRLPPRLGDSTDFSFSGWVYWGGGGNWQRIFDLGNGTDHFLCLTPKAGNGLGGLRFTIKNGGDEQQLNHNTALPVNTWTHVAVTIGGDTGKLFVNGALVATNSAMTINPVSVGTHFNYLAKSQFNDPLFNGRIDDARFFTTALSDAQVAAIAASAQPEFGADTLVKAAAAPHQPYVGSLAEDVSGGPVTFSKLGGPAWLAVAADGSLTGAPTLADTGLNAFLVRVATASGTMDTALLHVPVGETPGLVQRYAFEGSAQAAAGSGHGTASGNPAYVAGFRGQAIDLDGSDDFVTLPAGVANHDEITLATWVNWDGGGNWQRIFDFGNGTGSHLFLTPRSGSNRMLFLIRHHGIEHAIDTNTLATGQWVHVAVTIGGGNVRLFVNGGQVSSVACTLKPADIQPVSNFLGKSQFPDPLLNGRLDEFLIFNRALSAAEIVAVRNGQAPVFGSNPIHAPAAATGQAYEQFLGASASDPDSGTTLVYSKAAGPRWLTVAPNGRISGVPAAADAGANRFVLRATDSTGLVADAALVIPVAAPADLIAVHQFHNDSTDAAGGAGGVNVGGPVYDDGVLDRAIRLDGVDDHVRLRNGVVNGLTDITVAVRFRWDGGNAWQRVFDFGNNTTQYMLLTPRSGPNTLRFTISTGGNAAGAEQILESTMPPVGEWTHAAVTLIGNTGTLYVNGSAVDSRPITIDPAAFNPTLNYIGRSQYNDPYFNGLIDDVRIFSRGLSSAEVKSLAVPAAPALVPDASFEGWAAGIGFPPGKSGPGDDPDDDGVVNLLEYLFSTDPLAAGGGGWPRAGHMTGALLAGAPDPEKTYLTLQARVRRNRPGVTLIPEAAATPGDLALPAAAANVAQASPPELDGDHEIFTWFHKMPVEDADRGFMRLRVVKE